MALSGEADSKSYLDTFGLLYRRYNDQNDLFWGSVYWPL